MYYVWLWGFRLSDVVVSFFVGFDGEILVMLFIFFRFKRFVDWSVMWEWDDLLLYNIVYEIEINVVGFYMLNFWMCYSDVVVDKIIFINDEGYMFIGDGLVELMFSGGIIMVVLLMISLDGGLFVGIVDLIFFSFMGGSIYYIIDGLKLIISFMFYSGLFILSNIIIVQVIMV